MSAPRFPSADSHLLERLRSLNTTNLTETDSRMHRLRERTVGLGRAATAVLPARTVTRHIELLACALLNEGADMASLGEQIHVWARFLSGLQYEDGSFDTVNRRSPPDTAFVVRSLAASALLLARNEVSTATGALESMLTTLAKAGEILISGGVHTPNHRWIVCDALARINELAPDHRYLARMDEWLAEGLDLDPEGQFSERSAGIYSPEIDRALISLHQRLGRAELLEAVRANLSATLALIEPNGEIVTIASRRQDQGARARAARYYLPYRYVANIGGEPSMVAVAEEIERRDVQLLATDLTQLLDPGFPPVTSTEPTELPSEFRIHFPTQGLVRFRRNERTASVFGGSDWPRGTTSGLSSNPTFFTYRNGKAIIDSVRFVADFFSKGYFRSEGLRETGDGYLLQQTLQVPYYQPLPLEARRADGAYELSPAEDRFYARMSFPLRKKSDEQSLRTVVTVRELSSGGFGLHFQASGCPNVPVAIEINLRAGGTLHGVAGPLAGRKLYLLESGFCVYENGEHTVRFGPGTLDFHWGDELLPTIPRHLSPPLEGHTVYLTGHTPFDHVLTIE